MHKVYGLATKGISGPLVSTKSLRRFVGEERICRRLNEQSQKSRTVGTIGCLDTILRCSNVKKNSVIVVRGSADVSLTRYFSGMYVTTDAPSVGDSPSVSPFKYRENFYSFTVSTFHSLFTEKTTGR